MYEFRVCFLLRREPVRASDGVVIIPMSEEVETTRVIVVDGKACAQEVGVVASDWC